MSKNFQSGNSPAPEPPEIVNETLERLVADRTAVLQEKLSQVDAELRMYKERFEAFFSATSQLVWVADVQGRVHDTVSWRAFTGQTVAKAKGFGWLDAIHPDDRQRFTDLWLQAVTTQSLFNAEYRLRAKDGTYRYFVAQGVPVLNEDGCIREIVGTSTDVHEQQAALRDRKIAENALKQSEERFRCLMEATAQFIWNTNAEGELITEQSSWSKFTGLTFAEYKGWGWVEAIHPDDRKYVAETWAKAVSQRSYYEVECRMRRHDGKYRYMNCRGVPILNPDGTIREWIGANTDITERQETEAALRQKEAQYRSIFETVNDGIAIFELETGRVISANPAKAEMHGYTVEEFLQLAPGSFIHPDSHHLFKDCMKTVKAGQKFSCQAIDLHKNGTHIYVEVTAVPYWQDGKLYALSLVRDLSDRQAVLRERQKAELALQQSEQRFRSLIEATTQIIWTTNAQGEAITELPSWSKFTGQTFAEYKGWGWLNAFHPDDQDHTAKAWSAAVINRTLFQCEHRLRRHDGEYRYMSARAVPIMAADGSINEWVGIHIDITERREAEVALQKSEERFRSLIQATAQIIWNADTQGELLPNQTTWSNFTGQTFADYKNQGWGKVIHPEDLSRVAKTWSAAVANGTLFQDEFRIRRHDGEYRYMNVRGVPILEANGSVREWVGANTDITERREAEIALQQSEERFRSLIEATAQIIWNTNAQGELFPNQSGWGNFTGQSCGEYKGWGWLNAVHPDDRDHTVKAWSIAVNNRTVFQTENRLRRYDGEYRYMSIKGVPILDANGSIREWIGVHTDITERRQAEIDLQQNEERFRSLIEATTDIIWNANAQGQQMLELTNWSKFTGQTNEERIGWGWLNAVHPDDHPHTTKIWLASVANKTLYEVDYRVRRHDGEYRDMSVRGVPILAADGDIREWIGVCSDITERKKAESALTQAKEAAETANRAKSEFLANMSHELRTPLNGIIGYAQILLRGRSLSEEDRSRMDVIYQCGSHLLTLINDILDLSKIEAGKVELIPTDFHFPAFLQGVAEMCRIRAELKGIQFHYQSTTELPIGIHADEKRLRQVLINLLTNAIKFTDTGSVNFTVSFASPGKIRFQVQDTGIGIAPEKIQAIFLPFEQVSDAKRQSEGTGLGLAISQEIVGLMGSEIQVQSEVNVGSIFWFDINLIEAKEWIKNAQSDDKGQIIGIKDAQPKILVIDDKWENRSVINNLLSPIGFIVFEATSGQEGWQKIREHQPNLIITDLLMPKGDGFELIKRIRQEIGKNLTIIVSSASVFESDQYRSIEAGGNDFLAKPVMARELLEKLQKYLQLKWIYEEKAPVIESHLEHQKLIPPPAEELEIIHELAMKGNFKGIIKQASLLEETDQKYIPFAKKIYQLAKGFQDREILALVQSFK